MAVIGTADKSKNSSEEYQFARWPLLNVVRHWKECKCVMSTGPVLQCHEAFVTCPLVAYRLPYKWTVVPEKRMIRTLDRTWCADKSNFVEKNKYVTIKIQKINSNIL